MSKHVVSLLSNLEMRDLIQADKYHVKVNDFPLLIKSSFGFRCLRLPGKLSILYLQDLEVLGPKQSIFGLEFKEVRIPDSWYGTDE